MLMVLVLRVERVFALGNDRSAVALDGGRLLHSRNYSTVCNGEKADAAPHTPSMGFGGTAGHARIFCGPAGRAAGDCLRAEGSSTMRWKKWDWCEAWEA
jgi:hypothetical protein